jgi:NADPH:quinone reductase-like Zn-dependent oxidoreductase
MKAVRFHEYGDPDVLRYEDVEQPAPGPGEVRIQVAATSFNGIDAGIRSGNMQGPFPVTLPHIPGIDVAGTVEELGEGVDNVAVGDQVIGFLPMVEPGASAEFAIAPAEFLAPAPTSIPLADAASLPVVGLTARQALFDLAGLESGQRLLISGAGGAVGGYAIQLAKRAGAYVIATAGPRSNAAVLEAGADEVIDHTATDVVEAVGEPVDVLLNLAPIAPDQLGALASKVGDGGVVVITTVWMEAPSDEARGVRGIQVFVNSDAGQLSQLVDLIDAGELRTDVAERVPLADLRSVHERNEAGELPGKVVITVGEG